MRVYISISLALIVAMASSSYQQQHPGSPSSSSSSGGFLGSLRNFFRPRRQSPFRQQHHQQQHPPQFINQPFQQQPHLNGFGGGAPQQHQQQPQFKTQSENFQQQPRQPFHSSNNNINFRQNTNFITRPQQQPNQFTLVNNNNQAFRQEPLQQQQQHSKPFASDFKTTNNNKKPNKNERQCRALPFEDPEAREFPRCPDAKPNHFWKGKSYILTFNLGNDDCTKFTGYQADNYCKAQGGRAVSLDSNEKSEHFLDVSAQFAQRYYWTGGRMNHPCKTLYWPSGKSEGWEAGKRYWSHTGGSKTKKPQPDNRNHDEDGLEDEICLAVLNNFYNDNIKWHDVACHHKKPTICELDN